VFATGRIGRVELAQVYEAGEAPVALFCHEAVVGICESVINSRRRSRDDQDRLLWPARL
jgi:hypothetical protein